MSTPYGGYSPNPAASSKVATVALAMQVAAGLTILWELCFLLLSLLQFFGVSMGHFAAPGAGGAAGARMAQLMGGGLGLAIILIMIVANAFVIFAGQKMKALESYSLVIVGVVLLILPASCSCCCIANIVRLPIGIWALITLLDSEVKASFRS
jgi:hypothetical protein